MLMYMLNNPLHILRRRLELFLKGERRGINVGNLHASATAHFNDLNSLLKSNPQFSFDKKLQINSLELKYEEYLRKAIQIVNPIWNGEKQLFMLLYTISSSIKDGEIVETGVANGFTTNSIMKALQDSMSSASLTSFDILPETINAYVGDRKWNFQLLSGRRLHKQLQKIVDDLSNISLWVHDSDHSYKWQKFEYTLASQRLRSGGILVSDDIDTSAAWITVIPKYFKYNYVIFDSRKFIGIAIK